MSKAAIAAIATATLCIAAPASADTFTWNGGSDFDIVSQSINPTVGNYVQFFGNDTSYGEEVGPFAHSHGQGVTWSILATINGAEQTIYSSTIAPTPGNDSSESIVALGKIFFGQGTVSSIGFTCDTCSGQTYHQFSGATFDVGVSSLGTPEPATWAMMLIGFGGLGYAMRRNRKSVAAFA